MGEGVGEGEGVARGVTFGLGVEMGTSYTLGLPTGPLSSFSLVFAAAANGTVVTRSSDSRQSMIFLFKFCPSWS